jgi:phosphoadenosine phosphosulfate reductase
MGAVRTAVLPFALARCAGGDGDARGPRAELRPVYDRPILHFAVAEARRAGIERFVFVAGAPDAAPSGANVELIEATHGTDLAPGEVCFVRGPAGRGLAGALAAARELVDGEPFAVVEPELLRLAPAGGLDLVVRAFEPGVAAVVGCVEAGDDALFRFDVVEPAGDTVARLRRRPAPTATTSRLAAFGRWVADPALLDTIDATTASLAEAVDRLARRRPVRVVELAGEAFDTRTPSGLLKATIARARACPVGASVVAQAQRDHVDAGVETPRSAALTRRYDGLDPRALLTQLVVDDFAGELALVSSFGADSVVLLHMIARIAPDLPVLFLDTGKLFAETARYRDALTAELGLADVRDVRPGPARLAAADPDGGLHARAPDRCCALRKTEPLEAALDGFAAWITGRKRFQSALRAEMPLFEEDGAGRIKVNPLAAWSRADVEAYIARHDLPRHPLVAKGYASIGCAPCTSPVAPGEDERAGRWRDSDKTECGLHLEGGRLVRGAAEG